MSRQAIAKREECVVAVRLTLVGRVQGIGLRPAIARWASRLGLAGRINNTLRGVELVVEGLAGQLERFEDELNEYLPPIAFVERIDRNRVEPSGLTGFEIIDGQSCGPPSTRVPTDIAVCDECLDEVAAKDNIRNSYPLTSCTACGPRYSIIERLPYERAQTSMEAFPLCQRCLAEYRSPDDRRFHAQTNACPQCGPQVWCSDHSGRQVAQREQTLEAAAGAIYNGKILALRGLGGYQLIVDATSSEAVARLQQRKGRHGKPLAVMVLTPNDAKQLARLDADEMQTLCSRAAPIVVAESRGDSSLAADVSPGLNTIGLMLPTTALHWLLLRLCRRPLVVTSGNREGEPLVYKQKCAREQLADVADLWLEHDRPIVRPIDDSVVRVIAGRPVTIRLARGLAPLSLELESGIPTLALGGQQKTAVALCSGQQAVLGPHIGNLDSLAVCDRFAQQIESLKQLYAAHPSMLVCDQHPDYFSSQWAVRQLTAIENVQHHHGHVVAGMLEHQWLDRTVLGVTFDGTGYGSDATVWGGEFLLSTATRFTRVGHLRPFRLPGGELAVRQPWRVAVALVAQAAGKKAAASLQFDGKPVESLLGIVNSPRLSPLTSSAGRLFDGVAALALGITHCDFEGQAAMLLEAACDLVETGSYSIELKETDPLQLDWRPMITQLLNDRRAGVPFAAVAMRFHRGLACAVAGFCRRFASVPVVLGGGVFQNRVLVELLKQEFDAGSQPLGLPGVIPPNDGGLAAGQLAVAIHRRQQKGVASCV